MTVKMQEPVIKLAPPPAGWVMASRTDDNNDLSSSSCTLPDGVRKHIEARFHLPRRSRGAGQPTESLLRHLGLSNNRSSRSAKMSHSQLMVKLFLYFFTEELLQKVVNYTNAKARELVQKKEGQPLQQRCIGWQHDLTVGELIVWIGIVFKMGAIGHNRISHYWNKRDGFGVESIKKAMTGPRFANITAMISFAPLGTASGWAKFAEVDEYLQRRCQSAVTICKRMTVDESMIKGLSKLCPWIVYMPRKPIKMGVKVTKQHVCVYM